jgi:tRNA(Ile2) C34 agmatinyltransferase TiaS
MPEHPVCPNCKGTVAAIGKSGDCHACEWERDHAEDIDTGEDTE